MPTLPAASDAGLVAGWSLAGSLDFGDGMVTAAGQNDVVLAAYPRAGGVPRTARYGGSGFERPSSISLDAEGSAVIIGIFIGTLDFGTTDSGDGVLTSSPSGDVFVAFLSSH